MVSPEFDVLALKARAIRSTCIQMAHDGKESHLNGALSCVDILLALFHGWLRLTPENHQDPHRDRLIFSKGHACTALYAVMADLGFFPKDWLAHYAENDGPLPSHPCTHALPVLDWSSGSLGHGLGVASGMAYGLKLDRSPARVAVVLSDGECNEGSTWEAAMFAVSKRVDNLLAVVDYNRIQSIGRTDDLTGGASFTEKFRAFGWEVQEVDGHDPAVLHLAMAQAPLGKGRPTAIVARTRAGKGVSFMEDQVLWHYRTPSDEDVRRAFDELNAVPIHVSQGRRA